MSIQASNFEEPGSIVIENSFFNPSGTSLCQEISD